MKFLILAFALALAPVHASAQINKKVDPLLKLVERSPESLENLVKIEGDSLDPSYKVSTQGVTSVVSKGWLASTTVENSFLRAFISKKTGEVSAQVYHSATYGGRGWHHFQRASFDGPNGLEEVKADRVGTDVSCSRYGCTHYEDVVFEIPWATIEAMAAKYDPANPQVGLKYRLFGQSGQNFDEAIPINEIVAFANVVRKLRGSITPAK